MSPTPGPGNWADNYARDRTQTPELADKDALRREFGIARRPRGRRRRLAAEIIEQEERRG